MQRLQCQSSSLVYRSLSPFFSLLSWFIVVEALKVAVGIVDKHFAAPFTGITVNISYS